MIYHVESLTDDELQDAINRRFDLLCYSISNHITSAAKLLARILWRYALEMEKRQT